MGMSVCVCMSMDTDMLISVSMEMNMSHVAMHGRHTLGHVRDVICIQGMWALHTLHASRDAGRRMHIMTCTTCC